MRWATLDLELFAVRNFRWGNLAMLTYSTAFSAMFFALILFLVNVWEWSILKSGFAVAPGPLAAALLAPRFGSLAGRIGQRPLVFPQVTSAAAQALPANRVGVGGATTQAVRQFGGSFGVAVTIALLGTAVGVDALLPRFDRVWWFLIFGGLLTTVLAVPLRTPRTP